MPVYVYQESMTTGEALEIWMGGGGVVDIVVASCGLA